MKQINDETFDKEVIEGSKRDKAILVFYTAQWCSQSKSILNIAEKMEEDGEYKNRVRFLNAVIEDMMGNIICPRIKQECNVTRYPKMDLFKNGRQIASEVSEKIPMYQILDIKYMCRAATETKS